METLSEDNTTRAESSNSEEQAKDIKYEIEEEVPID